jgi:hypothetical protein
MNNFPAFTSLALKLIGIIFILSSLLDYVTLAFPLNWESAQWQIGLVTSIVDRGVVPLVGMGFILVGYVIDGLTDANPLKKSGFDLKFPVYILAAVLGLVINEVKKRTEVRSSRSQKLFLRQRFMLRLKNYSP